MPSGFLVAAIFAAPPLGGEAAGWEPHATALSEFGAFAVRERFGPVANFKTALVVDRLPKTRSAKILRGALRQIADGAEYGIPAVIDDKAILGEISDSLKGAGYSNLGELDQDLRNYVRRIQHRCRY